MTAVILVCCFIRNTHSVRVEEKAEGEHNKGLL